MSSSNACSRDSQRGQAMLIAVLTLGASMLGATTIAGLLMLYQIRQATDFGNSAKSVFAADAGSEWALYSFFRGASQDQPMFSNGAAIAVNCYDNSNPPVVTPCNATTSAYAISKGSAGDTRRAFLATFGGATTSLP
ncbi:MAG: hypothetical protein WCF77_03970 [Minisyncoccia bacterium]